MPFTYTGSTTFAEAVTKDAVEFNLTTTVGITKGYILVNAAEIMTVRAIPVVGTPGRVSVTRGGNSTAGRPHASGETVYFGAPSDFALIKDNAMKLFKPLVTLPDICIPGTRGMDVNGYEYILLDSTSTVGPGYTVVISKDGLFTCAVPTTASQGNIALTVEDGTSDQWIWALIRGAHPHAKLMGGSSLMTSTGILGVATSTSSPTVGLLGQTTSQAGTSISPFSWFIHKMWPSSAATTTSTASSSETALYCSVWLEYPYLDRRLTS